MNHDPGTQFACMHCASEFNNVVSPVLTSLPFHEYINLSFLLDFSLPHSIKAALKCGRKRRRKKARSRLYDKGGHTALIGLGDGTLEVCGPILENTKSSFHSLCPCSEIILCLQTSFFALTTIFNLLGWDLGSSVKPWLVFSFACDPIVVWAAQMSVCWEGRASERERQVANAAGQASIRPPRMHAALRNPSAQAFRVDPSP